MSYTVQDIRRLTLEGKTKTTPVIRNRKFTCVKVATALDTSLKFSPTPKTQKL